MWLAFDEPVFSSPYSPYIPAASNPVKFFGSFFSPRFGRSFSGAKNTRGVGPLLAIAIFRATFIPAFFTSRVQPPGAGPRVGGGTLGGLEFEARLKTLG